MSFEQAVTDLEATNAALVQEVVRVRDAAMGLSRIYPSTAEGLAAVADGQYFAVPGSGDTYMTLYRRNGSSATEISKYPSQAAVDEIMNLLGTAAYANLTTHATDTATGRVLRVGDYGEGTALVIDQHDVQTALPNGNYYLTNPTNRPPGVSAGASLFAKYKRHSGTTVWSVDIAVVGTGKKFTGVFISPDFTWKNEFNNENILGTVSQSSGVPTGAIIERGSNANGEYVRYADGTQECWSPQIRLGYVNANSCDFTWTFPASFVSTSYGHSINGEGFAGLAVSKRQGLFELASRTTTSAIARLSGTGSFTSGDYVDAKARVIGRWY
jgi:hypothetical protein